MLAIALLLYEEPMRADFGLTLLLYAAMFVISDLLSPKPDIEDAKPAGLGDFQVTTATEGRPVPMAWGTNRLSGPNVIWYGDLLQEAIVEEIRTGLFSKDEVVRGFRYHLGVQWALHMGVADELTRIYCEDDVIFEGSATHEDTITISEPELFGGEELGNGGLSGVLQFFSGTNDQDASGYFAGTAVVSGAINNGGSSYSPGDVVTCVGGTFTTPARFRVTTHTLNVATGIALVDAGVYSVLPSSPVTTTGGGSGLTIDLTFRDKIQDIGGKTPAYGGLTYVCPYTSHFYFGNSTQIKQWKFETRRTPNFLSLTSNRHIVNDGDANPANVLYEILTNTEWGYRIDASEIDAATFVTVANTLFDEGNGFSFVLDSPEDIGEMVTRIEEQIDGILYQNDDGDWTIVLVRDDYDPLLVTELNDENVLEIRGFTFSTWEGTKNQVRLPFNQRNDDYKQTYGFAQDPANMRIVGKATSTSLTHPGVKDADLANSIAWRALRTLATPLAKGDFVCNRTVYNLRPGDAVVVTITELALDRLPMRVRNVDYGSLTDGAITLSLVQDIFRASPGSFAPPPTTGWGAPEDTLVAFSPDEQLAFEAPRALTLRDPDSASPTVDKVYASARRQGVEAMFDIRMRHSAGTPSGAFTTIGSVFQFVKMGTLNAALPVGSAYPASTIVINAAPDTQTALETLFPDITDLVDLGTELLTLILVGGPNGEFMLVSSAQTSGANVQLNSVYRGVLDSVQQSHEAGEPVYLLFVGGGMGGTAVLAGHNVHVKLIPRSLTGEVDEADATQIAFTMENRTRRPYPPSEMTINGTRFDATVTLEAGAGTGDAIGIDLTFKRRDFRTVDEVAALLDDAATIDATFPTAHNTTTEIDVYDDTTGTPVFLFTQNLGSGTTGSIRRLDILEATNGELPTDLVFALRASHTFEGVVYESRYELSWGFALASALTGQFEFGALDTNDVSAIYTVDAGGTNHVFTLSSAFTLGAVERRINGGAWTSLIAAGGTSGTILGGAVVNGDTIEIRHLSTDVGAQKLITLNDGAAAAFGVLYV